MRRLIFGAFSPTISLHVYEEGDGYYIQSSNGKKVTLRECVAILSSLKKGDVDRHEHYLIKEDANGWFCEFVAKYYPSSEVFVVGYGNTKSEAVDDCFRRIHEIADSG